MPAASNGSRLGLPASTGLVVTSSITTRSRRCIAVPQEHSPSWTMPNDFRLRGSKPRLATSLSVPESASSSCTVPMSAAVIAMAASMISPSSAVESPSRTSCVLTSWSRLMPARSAASCSSARLRSVMSRAIPMIPCGRPAASVTRRTRASIQTRVPSR